MAFQAVFPRVMHLAFGPGLATSTAVSWWQVTGKTCVAAYQPIGAASLAASYINLANPGTYDAAPGVAPTWASLTGWAFVASQYLKTGVVPASGYSILVRFMDSTASGDNYLAGCTNSSGNEFWVTHRFIGLGCNYANGTRLGAVLPNETSGVLAFAGSIAYRNGVAEAGSMLGTYTITRDIYIGGLNTGPGGFYGKYLNTKICAIAIYSDTLTAGEVATVSAAMAALTG